MRFNFNYSNNGELPTHIEDIVMMLKFSIESIPGNTFGLSRSFDLNACNIMMENFVEPELERTLLENNIDFIIIASEFITGSTFNQFEEIPLYGHQETWQRRFNTFMSVAEYARAVWCLSDDAVDAYREKIGNKAYCFPMTYIPKLKSFDCHKYEDKDIDILFTGTKTSYRGEVLTTLEAKGFNVAVYPMATPTYIRNDLCSRAKVALNIRQSDNWKYPSLMRYHYHIMNRVPLISEKCDVPSYLDKYIISVSNKDLADACWKMIEDRGKQAQENYQAFPVDMPCEKFIPKLMDDTLANPVRSRTTTYSTKDSKKDSKKQMIGVKITEKAKSPINCLSRKILFNNQSRKFLRKIDSCMQKLPVPKRKYTQMRNWIKRKL